MSTSNSPTTPTFVDRLTKIADDYAEAREYYEANEDEEDEEPFRYARKAFTLALEEMCELTRQAAAALAPQELHSFLRKASNFETELLEYAYTEEHSFWEAVPPCCGNLAKDKERGPLSNSMRDSLLPILEMVAGSRAAFKEKTRTERGMATFQALVGKAALPFDPASKPSSYTSTLARFRENRPSIPDSTPSALRALLEARCEVSAVNIAKPIAIAGSASALALLGCDGWKDRDPHLEVYKLADGEDWADSLGSITPGLKDVTATVVLDDVRRLAFIAGSSRIKSFQWDEENTGDDLLPVHTMDSGSYGGPLALLQGGAKLLRASKNKLMVWDVDSAPTRGKKGGKNVGKKRKPDGLNTRPDDTDKIELSGGSDFTQTISLGDEFSGGVKAWAQHPSQPSSMISGLGGQYRCVQLDVETGQIANHWVGHGHRLNSVHTSPADPWSFLTACVDGATRLYDVRQPAPVLAVYSSVHEATSSALLMHISGQPYIFAGGTASQQVKCWDVRARLPLYELATGNNDVTALAWDAPRCALYAQTECGFIDHTGRHSEYRKFKGPGRVKRDVRCWPEDAFHDEQAFEYPLDCGDHSLFRYAFKPEPDVKQVPAYGDASC
ncbi:hypothetical protein BOTBODRAFT_52225 [Botryobasidium botryosum FD-172 SS1]|uniref:Uncharacterized protein n=1 Tax=Botryobasidium botryosum (strain FD-172 SS1) TaxID=930990 RepID=A0A067MWF4_BOTB1|nr:hypothetical protein BOTBODRAFT_52225 [Botryobasidium botryosum FD-172 SS1]